MLLRRVGPCGAPHWGLGSCRRLRNCRREEGQPRRPPTATLLRTLPPRPRALLSWPPSSDMDHVQLVNRVKSFQRGTDERKRRWQGFCAANASRTRDPARYSAAQLRAFLATDSMTAATT